MIRVMTFIDGRWLSSSSQDLSRDHRRPDFRIDFAKLPEVATETLFGRGFRGRVDIVRSYYFGTYAENCDARDAPVVQRRREFYSRLQQIPHFDVVGCPVDYKGRRLRASDRDPDDKFAGDDGRAAMALGARAMHLASIPGAMDVAIMLVGDARYVPLLQELRGMGRRVAIASIQGCCADELSDVGDAAGVRDFSVVWLNDILGRIERWRARPRLVRPDEDAPQRPHLPHTSGDTPFRPSSPAAPTPGGGAVLHGQIKNIIWDRGYGFIAADDDQDYFFHANALGGDLTFDDLEPDMMVAFEVKTPPSSDRAGAAGRVWHDPDAESDNAKTVTLNDDDDDEDYEDDDDDIDYEDDDDLDDDDTEDLDSDQGSR